MYDDFGIAARAEGITQRLQLRHQLAVVVDLAVENYTDRTVSIEQRLLPGRQIDNRQAPMTERESRL
jgi:hypothetical protein